MNVGERRIRLSAAAAAAVSLVALLAGCASAHPSSGADTIATPTVHHVVDGPTVALSGSGPASASHAVPAGARSVAVSIACTSGLWSVSSAGDLDDELAGTCSNSVATFSMPVPSAPTMDLEVTVPAATRFTLTARFSSDPAPTSAATASVCRSVSAAVQALGSGGAAWKTAATAALEKAAAHADPLTAPEVATLQQSVSAATTPTLDAQGAAARQLVTEICNSNFTPVTLTSAGG